jgi:PAS domain-containing protein
MQLFPGKECKEALSRSILDNICRPHILLDRDMRIVAFNGEAGRLFALHHADAKGLPFSVLFASRDGQRKARRSNGRQSWRAEACSGIRFPAMVRAIADIGDTLGLECVTELRAAGVDYAKDFGVQRPFPLSDLASYRPPQDLS